MTNSYTRNPGSHHATVRRKIIRRIERRGCASRISHDCSPRMTHASPHKSANLRSLAMRSTRFLRCPSDPREEPHITMTGIMRRVVWFQHSQASRASARGSLTHVHSMHVARATSCTGCDIDCACGADVRPPPACGPEMALARPCAAKCALGSRASTQGALLMAGFTTPEHGC